MSARKINQPRRHRDTEILCVFVSSVACSLCALRSLGVDYSDSLSRAALESSNVSRLQ